MEKGLVVEEAPPEILFGRPGHAYTKRLVAASPTRTSTVESLVVDGGGSLGPAPAVIQQRAATPLLQVTN
ncbi:hypothetical protein, partial [Stenotrophomonas maltophilia]|uniref:hypothetical protein n=1 Tax=Stenotrophomonas maltophilia TaxID=40324 RepID=UPI0019530164